MGSLWTSTRDEMGSGVMRFFGCQTACSKELWEFHWCGVASGERRWAVDMAESLLMMR